MPHHPFLPIRVLVREDLPSPPPPPSSMTAHSGCTSPPLPGGSGSHSQPSPFLVRGKGRTGLWVRLLVHPWLSGLVELEQQRTQDCRDRKDTELEESKLPWSVWTAVTKYNRDGVGLQTITAISHISRGWDIQVQGCVLVPGEGFLFHRQTYFHEDSTWQKESESFLRSLLINAH